MGGGPSTMDWTMRPCQIPFPRPVRRLLPGEAKSAPLRLYSTSTDGLCMVVVVHAESRHASSILHVRPPLSHTRWQAVGRRASALTGRGRFWAGLAGPLPGCQPSTPPEGGDDQIVFWTGESGVSIGEDVVEPHLPHGEWEKL